MTALIAIHQGRDTDTAHHLAVATPTEHAETIAPFYDPIPLLARALHHASLGDTERAFATLAEATDTTSAPPHRRHTLVAFAAPTSYAWRSVPATRTTPGAPRWPSRPSPGRTPPHTTRRTPPAAADGGRCCPHERECAGPSDAYHRISAPAPAPGAGPPARPPHRRKVRPC